MPPLPQVSPETGAAPQAEQSTLVVQALQHQINYFDTTFRYKDEMRRMIFPLSPLNLEIAAHGKTRPVKRSENDPGPRHHTYMLGCEFHHILLILWKESAFVTDAALEITGLKREFQPGAVNCNSLGKKIARNVIYDLTAAVQRVQQAMVIAKHYGLVEEMADQSNKHSLHGTELLHRLFLSIESPDHDRNVE